jgi:hypothetical protein
VNPFHTAVDDEPAAASPLTVLVTRIVAPVTDRTRLGLK